MTSTHHPVAGDAPSAYAVCDGLLLVQDAGSSLVNLVLKPLQAPPFAFPNIRFFVYRGVAKSSLVSGTEVAPATSNDLTKSIWESQQARNASAGTSDNPPVAALGLDITSNGLIEDVFFRDGVSHQLPLVRAGWTLGTFAPGFGFEILVDAPGFEPGLALVRTPANVITVPAPPASPTQAQEFDHWHDKEAILGYVDPCAFFGSFFFSKLKVHKSDGTSTTARKNEIYDQVLTGSHLTSPGAGVFFNRNRIYVDIRNEFGHSLNYFKNYGTYSDTTIQCAFESDAIPGPRNYYASGWPLMIVGPGDFPLNTSSAKNVIRLAFPDGSGDNPHPTLYISAGYLEAGYPRAPKQNKRLIDLTPSSGFTDEVTLVTPNRTGLSSTTVTSSWIKLKYFKRLDPAAPPAISSATVMRSANALDNLFAPFAMRIPFGSAANSRTMVYDDEVFVSLERENRTGYIARIGKAEDPANITFFLLPAFGSDSSHRLPKHLFFSSEQDTGAGGFLQRLVSLFQEKELRKSTLTLSPSPVEYLEVVDAAPEPAGEGAADGVITISIDRNEYQSLPQAPLISKYPRRLGLITNGAAVDAVGQEYTAYDVVVRGYENNAGMLQVRDVSTGLRIYFHGRTT